MPTFVWIIVAFVGIWVLATTQDDGPRWPEPGVGNKRGPRKRHRLNRRSLPCRGWFA